MTEELEQLLRNLKLYRPQAVYDEQLRAADLQQITYTDFVAGLLRAQWRDRQESALEWRIRRAMLPERWSLETFPYAKQPGVNRKQIRAFAELDFVAKRENLVFIGPTGVGKTGLASGILLKALQNGLRCQFIRAQDLFDEMYASLADRSTRRLVNRLARLDVLLIDEMGYANLKPEQANVFFKLMEERYHQRSTMITTNLAYEEWAGFLGNKTMVDAMLSRVRHYCHTVRIEGPSLREPGAERYVMDVSEYVRRVLEAYRAVPGTCGAIRQPDRAFAKRLYERGVALKVVENALVLACARRLGRPAGAMPLGVIRSLAYFSPVIDEVLGSGVDEAYFQHLRTRLSRMRGQSS